MGSRFMAMLALERTAAASQKALFQEIARQFPHREMPLTGMTPDGEKADAIRRCCCAWEAR